MHTFENHEHKVHENNDLIFLNDMNELKSAPLREVSLRATYASSTLCSFILSFIQKNHLLITWPVPGTVLRVGVE